jgi:hypothetical protein
VWHPKRRAAPQSEADANPRTPLELKTNAKILPAET